MPVTKLKKGYEAIEYVFKKALTKKGVQGITTIPGPAYKMQIKRLTDAMADKMGKMGYDINNVTEKQVQGLLDYAQAIDNQRLKNIERKFFDPSGKMKKEGQDIVKKGLEGLGKKKDPFMGWTPKVVPKETVTASPDRIRKGFSTQMKLNRPEENQALIKSFMRRENAEFNALSREQQKEIFDMFDAYMKPKPDMASGGIAGELHLYDGGRARFDKGGKFNPGRRKFLKTTGFGLGALSMLPFVGKFFKAAKPAIKAATPAAEVITRGADGIPDYAFDLIEVVKAKGTKEIMEGVSRRLPVQKKYTYKGVEVTEDGLGTTSVKKQHEGIGYDEAGEGFEGVNKEVGFEIRTGEDIVKQGGVGDDAGNVITADDEYFEATVRPDAEGKMKDMEEFIDDAGHLDLKKIADEIGDVYYEDVNITGKLKKAKGGRVSLSKGGLAHVLGV